MKSPGVAFVPSPLVRGEGTVTDSRAKLLRVFAAGLLGVHALGAAFLVLQAGYARPGALLIVLHRDVQRAEPFGGELDLVAVHERVETAVVGAGREDIARQQG